MFFEHTHTHTHTRAHTHAYKSFVRLLTSGINANASRLEHFPDTMRLLCADLEVLGARALLPEDLWCKYMLMNLCAAHAPLRGTS
jgi:hypothetical protein